MSVAQRYVFLFLLGFIGVIVAQLLIVLIVNVVFEASFGLQLPVLPVVYILLFPVITWLWCRKFPRDRIAAPLLLMLFPFGFWVALLYNHVDLDISKISLHSSMIMIVALPVTLLLSFIVVRKFSIRDSNEPIV